MENVSALLNNPSGQDWVFGIVAALICVGLLAYAIQCGGR